MIEIFKNPNPNRLAIISAAGNVFYFPSSLTVSEVDEVLYALYGEYVDWDATSKRNYTTEEFEEFGYAASNYAALHPEKTLAEVLNSEELRAYAEESFQNALWHDIQDAKEF